jgi:thiamine biosynthesis protein ThiS
MSLAITINGEARTIDTPVSVHQLLVSLGLEATKIAVERNLEFVPRSRYGEIVVDAG